MAGEKKCSATLKIINRLGLHARPAMAFVDIANQFKSLVSVRTDRETVDGKSIMQMMMLGATQGTELHVEVCGPDADVALDELRSLVNRKFDEE